MWAIIEACAHIVDWRFASGLVVGFVLTLRYIVVGVYHPIIREMEAMQDEAKDDNSGS